MGVERDRDEERAMRTWSVSGSGKEQSSCAWTTGISSESRRANCLREGLPGVEQVWPRFLLCFVLLPRFVSGQIDFFRRLSQLSGRLIRYRPGWVSGAVLCELAKTVPVQRSIRGLGSSRAGGDYVGGAGSQSTETARGSRSGGRGSRLPATPAMRTYGDAMAPEEVGGLSDDLRLCDAVSDVVAAAGTP
jgi:hypothetical protein